ncbi:unnamed protein product [Trichobilharzia szidati]|nr:unnamed protein product [Trichobilharzia szidati]
MNKNCQYNDNNELLTNNVIKRRKPKVISDSKYYLRVIVFTVILVVLIAIIEVLVVYFFGRNVEPMFAIIYLVIDGTLAIIIVFILLLVDATQDNPFIGFIFLCLYAIFVGLLLALFGMQQTKMFLVMLWLFIIFICVLGLFVGYKTTTDLTLTIDGFIGFYVMVYFAGIILAGIYFLRGIQSQGYFLFGISLLIILCALTIIIGQIVFRKGHINLRDKWPMSVLLLVTLISVFYSMSLSQYSYIEVITGRRRSSDPFGPNKY